MKTAEWLKEQIAVQQSYIESYDDKIKSFQKDLDSFYERKKECEAIIKDYENDLKRIQ